EPRQARDFVHFLVDRHLVDDVLEADRAAALGEDRERVRIPFGENLALRDLLAVLHLEARAVDDRVPLANDALVVHDVHGTAAVHGDELLRRRHARIALLAPVDGQKTLEPDGAVVTRLERGLLGDPRRRAADVERPHRQLRAGLADGLRGDDANRETELDQPAGREIAAVALGAHAPAGGARQHRADLHALDARVLDRVGELFVELTRRRHDDLAGRRIHDVIEGDAADDAVAEPFDDLTTGVDNRAGFDAVERAAVVLGNDHVLGDVDETACEIAGVGRLERRVRETLAGAVRRDEVLENGQSFAEVRRDGRLDDFA